jgi:hypothetical protein
VQKLDARPRNGRFAGGTQVLKPPQAPGPDNATLRRLTRSAIDYAQHVKHSQTPTRREAGIAADAVIQLANILRRLDEDE